MRRTSIVLVLALGLFLTACSAQEPEVVLNEQVPAAQAVAEVAEGEEGEPAVEADFAAAEAVWVAEQLAFTSAPSSMPADEVVMGDDPAGAVIELAVTPTAIAGPGTRDVTVRGIEIRHYAVRSQAAALNGSDTHDWTVVGVRAVLVRDEGAAAFRGREEFVEGPGEIGVGADPVGDVAGDDEVDVRVGVVEVGVG